MFVCHRKFSSRVQRQHDLPQLSSALHLSSHSNAGKRDVLLQLQWLFFLCGPLKLWQPQTSHSCFSVAIRAGLGWEGHLFPSGGGWRLSLCSTCGWVSRGMVGGTLWLWVYVGIGFAHTKSCKSMIQFCWSRQFLFYFWQYGIWKKSLYGLHYNSAIGLNAFKEK